MRHTPGPWEMDSIDGNVYSKNHVCVAIPHGPAGKNVDVKDEHEANARLIASAPDLLKALKIAADTLQEVVDWCDCKDRFESICLRKCQVQEAYNKAEGK